MPRFINIFGRYSAAIVVAFAVSGAIFALFTPIPLFLGVLGMSDSLVQFVLYIPAIIVGFSGVFTGSLCLERASRRFGSVVLLVLGLTFYVYTAFCIKYPGQANDDHPYLWLWGLAALALGGLVAVIFVFRRSSSNKSLQQTATAPPVLTEA